MSLLYVVYSVFFLTLPLVINWLLFQTQDIVKFKKFTNMKRFLLFFTLIIIGLELTAQVIKPMNKVYQKTQRGGIVFLSNVGMVCNLADTAAMPPSDGTLNDFTPSVYVDRDGDPSTFMSSSDSLNLPSCSDISFVGLFWGGHATAATSGWATKEHVKIRAGKNSYIDVVADSTGYFAGPVLKTYTCFKDVTSIVKRYGTNVRWTVANVVGQTGEINRFSGWNMIIVYKNESENLRQLTVYNGLSNILSNSAPVDVTVSGFKTPTSGSVSFELGVFSYEGDRTYLGDQLLVKGGNGSTFLNISNGINNADNVFNSTISRFGVLTPFRIPSYNNNFSIDADIFSPDNSQKKYIGNNETSMTLRTTTNQDVYLTQAVTLAIDAFIPDNRLGMRVRKIPKIGDLDNIVRPGDTLEYTLVGCNVGTDKSVESYIYNKLERNAKFVPGSIRIKSGPNAGYKTDGEGDDQAFYDALTRTVKVWIGTGATATHGGLINNDLDGKDSTVVTFRVTATDNCLDLQCDNVIDNHAYIHGQGLDSGIHFESDQVPQYFDESTCSIAEISNKSSVIVFQNCPALTITSNSPVCAGTDVTLGAPYSANATYSWVGPNGFTSKDQNPVITNPTSAYSGKYTLTLTLTEGSCNPFVLTTDVVVGTKVIANAGVDETICSTSTQLKGNTPTSGLGKWSLVSGTPSDVTISSTTSATTAVTFKKAGIYLFEWKLPDNGCSSIPDTVQISVGVGNCPLILDNETHNVKEGEKATGDLTNNGDIAFDNKFDVNTTPIITPKHGTIEIKTDGTYTFTPTAGFNGKDTVVVNICDYQLPVNCKNDTIFLNITAITPLVLDNEHHTIGDNETAVGDLTDSGDTSFENKFTITTTPVVKPKHGTIIINTDGTYIYTPKTIGADTIVVAVCDTQTPKICGTDTIFINVVPQNTVPVAHPDTYNSSTGKLSENDETPDGDLSSYTWTKLTDPVDVNGAPTGSVVVNKDGTFVYTPPTPDYTGKVTFTYEVTDVNGDKSSTTVTLNIKPLFIPEGFSPNGDGIHDRFVIRGIDNYPKNTISILNRWGNKVYEAHPYTTLEAWDGTNMFGVTVGGNVLPIGTYFYILDLGNGNKAIKGTVYLSR